MRRVARDLADNLLKQIRPFGKRRRDRAEPHLSPQ